MFSMNQDIKQKCTMPWSLYPSSQGIVSLISCVRRTWQWLYWLKSTKPKTLSWTAAKNTGKDIRTRKAPREILAGCSYSFWDLALQGLCEICCLGDQSATLGFFLDAWKQLALYMLGSGMTVRWSWGAAGSTTRDGEVLVATRRDGEQPPVLAWAGKDGKDK